MIEKSFAAKFIEMTKPRILIFQLFTASMGYLYATGYGQVKVGIWLFLLLGTGLLSAGGAILNNIIEKNRDKEMNRTQDRVMAQGTMKVVEALSLGLFCTASGTLILNDINFATAFVGLLTVLLYVFIYTPFKTISWLNTFVGAVPGALPPLGGWLASGKAVGIEAWLLFALLFLWQLPHFFAIDWMYRDDYKKGGFKMLSALDSSGRTSGILSAFFALILWGLSYIPFHIGSLGWCYFGGTFILGAWYFIESVKFAKAKTDQQAKKLLRVSVIYIPVLLLLFFIDLI